MVKRCWFVAVCCLLWYPSFLLADDPPTASEMERSFRDQMDVGILVLLILGIVVWLGRLSNIFKRSSHESGRILESEESEEIDTNNRVGETCWYRTYDSKKNKWNWKRGVVRNWSTDHVEYESGPGLHPVGVVEDCDTLRCKSIYVDYISFAACPPEEEEGV